MGGSYPQRNERMELGKWFRSVQLVNDGPVTCRVVFCVDSRLTMEPFALAAPEQRAMARPRRRHLPPLLRHALLVLLQVLLLEPLHAAAAPPPLVRVPVVFDSRPSTVDFQHGQHVEQAARTWCKRVEQGDQAACAARLCEYVAEACRDDDGTVGGGGCHVDAGAGRILTGHPAPSSSGGSSGGGNDNINLNGDDHHNEHRRPTTNGGTTADTAKRWPAAAHHKGGALVAVVDRSGLGHRLRIVSMLAVAARHLGRSFCKITAPRPRTPPPAACLLPAIKHHTRTYA